MSPREGGKESPSVRVPIALLAALALGGGGSALGARYLGESPAPVVDVGPIYRRLDEVDGRLRALETWSARADVRLDSVERSLERLERKLDRLDKKLDDAHARRR